MSTPFLFVAVLGATAVAAPVPVLATAAPKAEHGKNQGRDARAVLQIDTSEIGSAGPVIRRRVEERGNVVLRRSEILPGESGADPVVAVKIREVTGEDPGYAYEIWVALSGGEVEGSRLAGACELCTEGELVERVEEELEKVMPFVRKASHDPPPDEELLPPDGDSGEDEADPSPPDPTQTPRDGRGLGPHGKAGVGVLAAGAVGLGVGVALAIREPTPAQADATQLFTTRPAGYALLGVGAAVAITGVVLIVLDRRNRRGKSALRPVLGPGQAGLIWEGRF